MIAGAPPPGRRGALQFDPSQGHDRQDAGEMTNPTRNIWSRGDLLVTGRIRREPRLALMCDAVTGQTTTPFAPDGPAIGGERSTGRR
jgi:hypothetical protein